MTSAERTRWVVEQARAAGFDLCGVAPASDFPELARLPEWLDRGYAGEMRYLHDPRRQSPARVLDGARSVVVCALNYNTSQPYSTHVPGGRSGIYPERSRGGSDIGPALSTGALAPEGESALFVGQGFRPDKNASAETGASAPEGTGPRGWISRYAWGDDYHEVLGGKLDALVVAMRAHFPEPFDARAYVDTGPVVERVAARHAGLGWLAKNTCLINEELGSWLFLGVILTTLDLAPSLGPADAPPPDLCGNCTLCIDACPTGAIVAPYLLDARRCISYLTIELRGPIPEEFRAAMGRHVFGCDICQDVCPWNRHAPVTPLAAFQPRAFETRNSKLENGGSAQSADSSLFMPLLESLAALSEADFRRIFRGSPIKRTKHSGLLRNVAVALHNAGSRISRARQGP